MNKENKDHYVYVHRRRDNNVVFYVGHGRGKRMYSKHSRSRKWLEITNNSEWEYSIIKDNLTKSEAEDLEVLMIKVYDPVANIQRKSTAIKSIVNDCDFILSRYKYDESSISCIKYITDNNQHGKKKRKAGDDAGTFNKTTNRFTVSVNYKNRLAHRVVWFLCTGEDPIGFLIDHKDGDSSNNKISNLRKVTSSENNKNCVRSKKNSTGVKGVRLHTTKNNTYYEAYWVTNGNRLRKFFSIDKLGNDLALALATEYRNKVIIQLNLNGDSYSDRHVAGYVRHSILSNYSESEIDNLLK